MADLETLTLRITQESSKAFTAIKNLAQKLDALSVAVAKLEVGRLNDLSAGLINLNAAINVVKNNTRASDFTRLFKELYTLGSVDNARLDKLSASLMNLSNSFTGLSNTAAVATGVRDLVSSVSKLGGVAIERAVVNIPQLEQSLGHLITSFSQLPNVNQNVIDFTNSLANLASQGQKVGSAGTSVANSLERYSASAQRATRHSHTLASTIGTLYAKFWLFMRGATALKNSFVSAAEYLEAFNYFDVTARKIGKDTFRRAGVGTAEEYADAFTTTLREKLKKMSGLELDIEDRLIKTTNAKSLGLNITELTQYQAAIASLTNSMGVTQGVAEASAKALSMLAGDMASLRNMEFDEVASKLQSGLTGMARSLYAFGIDITNATLEEYAYANGIEKAVSEMSQSEKAQLRLLAILDQSKVAWGDLANTINSPSNQLRMLKTNLKETGTVFGQLFIPIMSSALPVINGLAMAIKQLMVEIAELLGIQLDLESFGQFGDEITEDIEGMEELNKAVEKTKKGIREFDELKVISTGKGSASGVGDQIDLTQEIIDATAEYEKVWDEAYERMTSKASEIAGYISQAFAPLKKIIEDFHIGDFFTAGEDVSALVISIFDFFTDAIKSVDWYGLGKKIGDFLAGIDWKEILRSFGNVIGSAIQGAFNLWTGAFSAAPFETAIITAFALLKFTGLGDMVLGQISAQLTKTLGGAKAVNALKRKLIELGFGAISIGVGISLTIDNITEIKKGNYSTVSVQSFLKSAISGILTGAGLEIATSAIGIASGGLAFAIGLTATLLFNFILGAANEPTAYEKAKKELEEIYAWVDENNNQRLEINTDIEFRTQATQDSIANLQTVADKVMDLSERYDELSAAEKGWLQEYSNQLVQMVPGIVGQIDEVTGAYKGTHDELQKLIDKEKEQIMLESYRQNLSDVTSAISTGEYDKKKLERQLQEKHDYIWNDLYDEYYKQHDVDAMSELSFDQVITLARRGAQYNDKGAYDKILKAIAEYDVIKSKLDSTNDTLTTLYGDQEYWLGEMNKTFEEAFSNMEASVEKGVDGSVSILEKQKLPNAVHDTLKDIDDKIRKDGAISERDMNTLFTHINNSFAGLDNGEVPQEIQRTMSAIKTAIITNSPELVRYMEQLKLQMEEAFVNAHYTSNGEILWNANNISGKLDSDVNSIMDALDHQAKPVLTSLEQDLHELFGEDLPSNVDKSFKNLADTINSGKGRKDIESALEWLENDIVNAGHDLGMNLEFGIVNGVYEYIPQVANATTTMVNDGLITPYKTETKTNSPSKVFEKLAEGVPEGAAEGIKEATPLTVRAIDTMILQMQSAFSGVKYGIPTLDFLNGNSRGSFDYGKMDSNNAFMSQMSGMASQMAQNGQTEVVFRIEGDPYGMFKIVREENDKYKRMHSNRSAFT